MDQGSYGSDSGQVRCRDLDGPPRPSTLIARGLVLNLPVCCWREKRNLDRMVQLGLIQLRAMPLRILRAGLLALVAALLPLSVSADDLQLEPIPVYVGAWWHHGSSFTITKFQGCPLSGVAVAQLRTYTPCQDPTTNKTNPPPCDMSVANMIADGGIASIALLHRQRRAARRDAGQRLRSHRQRVLAAAQDGPGTVNSAYTTGKVAVNWFTRCLALELAGTGATANTLHPGEVQTEMWRHIDAGAEQLSAEARVFASGRRWSNAPAAITPPPPPPPYVVELIRSGKDLR